MYARSNLPQYPKREESGGAQSFRRGSYNIPASYAGNAFSADFSPTEEELKNNIATDIPDPMPAAPSRADDPPVAAEQSESRQPLGEPSLPVMSSVDDRGRHEDGERRGGFLHDLLMKLDRGFELDDVLLIGLILLLSHDGENSSDTLILLAVLFFMGF